MGSDPIDWPAAVKGLDKITEWDEHPLIRKTMVRSDMRVCNEERNWLKDKGYKTHSLNATEIHQMYHVAMFETAMDRTFVTADAILEFGPGYGCLCKLAFEYGFWGWYCLFDFPELQPMQKTHIGENPKVLYFDKFGVERAGQDTIFVAIMSLSETSLELRNGMIGDIMKCPHWLICFQKEWGDIDNVAWFSELALKGGARIKKHPLMELFYVFR